MKQPPSSLSARHRRWPLRWGAGCLLLASSLFLQAEEKAALFFGMERPLIEKARTSRPEVPPEIAPLIEQAKAALERTTTPIAEKPKLAESGNPQDYYSIGIYWWPNPKGAELPYIRRDGHFNPESNRYDRPRLEKVAQDLHVLAWAYCATGEERYAQKARELLTLWFVDPQTRMNPNFTYAQAWPGWTNGSPTGIIEGVILARNAPDAIALLRECGALDDAMWEASRRWFADLLTWLEESPAGQHIATVTNNHASYYDVQRVAYAFLNGERERARGILQAVGPERLARQLAADGSQPAEMGRTKSFDYCCYNLAALVSLAEAAATVEVDLWGYTAPNGASLPKAFDYLIPYALGEKPWTHETVTGFNPWQLSALLRRAARALPDRGYAEAADQLDAAWHRAQQEKK